jgi:WD40 repeat protein
MVWDVRTGALKHSLHTRSGIVRALAFSPDGAALAAGSEGLWTESGQELSPPRLIVWDLSTALAFTPAVPPDVSADSPAPTLSMIWP